TTKRKLCAMLEGDLDTIALKALKKRAADRYPTADAFREDLRRCLEGEPVLARPDSRLYRASKFAGRHRVGLAAVAAVTVAVASGVSATLWQAQQARLQARRAQAVQEFVSGLFRQNDPSKTRGREITARELLDAGQRDVQSKLSGEPRLAADLQRVLVDLY